MITVITRTTRSFVFPLTKAECRELAECLLESLELEAGDLELCLVDDAEMSLLHEQHLGGIGPTNVLAFPEESEPGDTADFPDDAFAGSPDVYDGNDADEDDGTTYGQDCDDADDGEYCDDEESDDAEYDDAYDDEYDADDDDEPDGPEVFMPEMLQDAYAEGDEDFAPFVAGSIVFSVDALHRECVLYDQPPQVYFARLLAHAMLHLTGVPHGAFMEERMDFAVDQALASLAD